MKNIILIFILLFSIGTTFSKDVTVGVLDEAPWFFVDDKGINQGYVFNFLNELSKKSGVIFSYTPLPYKRGIIAFKEGSVSLFPDLHSSEVSKSGVNLGKIGDLEIVLVLRKTAAEKLKKEKSRINGCALRAANNLVKLVKKVEIHFQYVSSIKQCLLMLSAKRVSSIIVTKRDFNNAIKNNLLTRDNFKLTEVISQKLYLFANDSVDSELIKKLKAFLNQK